MTDTNRFNNRLNIVFLILFPGFFFYHTLATLEYIPPFLGGYSTLMAVIVLPGILTFYLNRYSSTLRPAFVINTIYWLFILYFFCIVSLNIAVGTVMEIALPLLGIIIQFVTLYIFGYLYDSTEEKIRKYLLLMFVLMTFIVVINIEDGAFRLVPVDTILQDDKLANYQNYAFAYSIVFLYLLSVISSTPYRFLTFIIGTFTLFIIGARSEFVGVFFAFLVLEVVTSKYRGAIFGVFFVLLVALYFSSDWIMEQFPNNRTVFLFGDFEGDASHLARSYMLAQGLQTIMTNPMWGDFASYELGHHIHNGLSAWVDLGILGFLVYASLIAGPLAYLVFNYRQDDVSPHYRLSLYMFILLGFLALTAKHFTHQLFPIALGIFARYLDLEQNYKVRTV